MPITTKTANLFTSLPGSRQWTVAGTTATYTGLGTAISTYIYFSDFGFSLTPGTTFSYISMSAHLRWSTAGIGELIRNLAIYNGSVLGSEYNLPKYVGAGDSVETYNDATVAAIDAMWGTTTLTPAIVNDSTFGSRFRLFYDHKPGDWFEVSDVTLSLTYTAPLTLNFTASVTSGEEPLSVEFTITSLPAFGDYLWDFGDGFVSTEYNPTHIYHCPGVYTVSLATGGLTETKTNYVYVVDGDPKMPEDSCCYAPYTVTCVGCTSGTGTEFYDNTKTYRFCRNVDCDSSCAAEYGSSYDIISDFVDDCPTCRECYLEDKHSTGRYYSLIISNCSVYITDFKSEGDCGTCTELAEQHCFKIKECDIVGTSAGCRSVFLFDGKMFIVTGSLSDCTEGMDCSDCWFTKPNPIDSPFDFLPDSLDSCTTTEQITPEGTEDLTISEPEISWHNRPSDETVLGAACTTEDLFTVTANLSLNHPDITAIPSGHSVIAYEERSSMGMTKIKAAQKATTVKNRIINWRSLGSGVLLNENIYDNGQKTLRIFDSADTSIDIDNVVIGFKNGPLAGKLYQADSIVLGPQTTSIYPSSSESFSYGIDMDIKGGYLYATEYKNSQSGTNKSRIIRTGLDGKNGEINSDDLILNVRGISNISNVSYLACESSIYSYNFDSEVETSIVATANVNRGIAADSSVNYVYYSSGGNIRRCKTDGSGDELLYATSDTEVYSLKLDESLNEIYWIESNNGIIRKSNIDGSGVETVFEDTITVPATYYAMGMDLDVSRKHIYWSEYYSGTIKRYDLVTGEIITIVDIGSRNRRMGKIKLLINSTSVVIYWISYNSVAHASPSGGLLESSVVSSRKYYDILFTEQVET